MNWNRSTTGATGKLPFGGLGQSGNHRPAALFAPLYCTYPVAELNNAYGAVPEQPCPGFPLEVMAVSADRVPLPLLLVALLAAILLGKLLASPPPAAVSYSHPIPGVAGADRGTGRAGAAHQRRLAAGQSGRGPTRGAHP